MSRAEALTAVCAGTLRTASPAAAWRVRTARGKRQSCRGLGVYKCGTCAGWHLGTSTQEA